MTPEHILFGSDYPHPEGLPEPFGWAEEVANLYPPEAVRKIMGGNMFDLLGVKAPAA
jgi:predicted TIM-barrel fold metal-dependent hydrolase